MEVRFKSRRPTDSKANWVVDPNGSNDAKPND